MKSGKCAVCYVHSKLIQLKIKLKQMQVKCVNFEFSMKRILSVMKYITIAVFCTLLMNGCYLGKTIDKQVTVFLDLSEFKVSTMDHTSNIQYLNYASEQEYRTAFLN